MTIHVLFSEVIRIIVVIAVVVDMFLCVQIYGLSYIYL